MNLNPFDERLKAVLDNIEVPYDSATWQQLSDRLDHLPARDGSWMDEALSRQLGHIEAPYQPAHWEQLTARLDREDNRRRIIYLYKLAEAAIFLLLLGYVLLMQTGFDPEGGPMARITPSNDRTNPANPPAHSKRQHAAANRDLSANAAMPFTMSRLYDGLYPQAGEEMPFQPSPASLSQTPLLSAEQETADTESVDNSQFFDSGAPAIRLTRFLTPENAPSTPARLLACRLATPNHRAPGSLKPARNAHWYAGLSGGMQLDRVQPGRQQQRPVSLDANLMWRKGKWGVTTGMRYSNRRFQPQPEVVIFAGTPAKGQYGAYIGEVEAQVVSVPVHATRRIARLGRVTAHAVAGLTTNIAATKSFRAKTVYYPGSSPDPNAPSVPPDYKYAANGLLEKGSFKDNYYVTADAGLRVEMPLSRRAAVFVESVWQQTLSGDAFVQPTARIHGAGVYAGVLAKL